MLLSVSSGDSALGYSAAYEYLVVKSTVFCWLRVLSGKVGVTISRTPSLRQQAATHVETVFLKAGDLAAETDVLELCVAAERISGRETIAGAQRIRGLWRIYPRRAAWTDRGVLRQEPIYTERGKRSSDNKTVHI